MATETRNNQYNQNASTDVFAFNKTDAGVCCESGECQAYFTATKDAAGDITIDSSTFALATGETKQSASIKIFDGKGGIFSKEMSVAGTSEEFLKTALVTADTLQETREWNIWVTLVTSAGTVCKSRLVLDYIGAVVGTAYYSQGHTA